MDASGPHLDEELQLLLDGRIDATAEARVREHLAHCPTCTGRYEALRGVKGVLADLRARESDAPASAEMLAAIQAALDGADRRQRRAFVLRRIGSIAATVALVVGAVLWLRTPPRDSPSADLVAQDAAALERGALALELRTTDVAELEEFFAARRLGFTTRVFDLGMMGYTLIGGAVLQRADGPHALFVYRAANGALVLCEMYRGDAERAIPHGERRTRGRITLHVTQRGNMTLAFWQEGDLVCVLAGRIERETVIELAFAKATAS